MKRDLIEIFGYSPDDLTDQSRSLWRLGACPFIEKECTKFNHDRSIISETSLNSKNNTITVYTYELGEKVKHGKQRNIKPVRTIRFLTADFANRFIQGPNLPSGENLDDAVSRVIGIK